MSALATSRYVYALCNWKRVALGWCLGMVFPLSLSAEDCGRAAELIAGAKALSPNERESTLKNALDHCPSLAEGHFALGRTLLQNGKSSEAIASFRTAVKSGKEAKYSLALGQALLAAKDFISAEKCYQDLLERDDQVIAGYLGLGAAFHGQQKFPEAESAFRRGIQIDPQNADLFFNLGVVLEDQRRDDEAASSYRAAWERRQSFKRAGIYLSRVLLRLSRHSEALETIKKVRNAGPVIVEELEVEAAIYDSQGQVNEALRVVDEALGLDAESEILRSNYAVLLAKVGRVEEGQATVERLIKIKPNCGKCYCARGWLNRLQGNLEQAEADFRKAIELDSRDLIAYRNLGELAEASGRKKESGDFLAKARELDTYGVLSSWGSVPNKTQSIQPKSGQTLDETADASGSAQE